MFNPLVPNGSYRSCPPLILWSIELLMDKTDYQGTANRYASLPPPSRHLCDARLNLVNKVIPGIFNGAHVLDIGCNDGRVTTNLGIALPRYLPWISHKFNVLILLF